MEILVFILCYTSFLAALGHYITKKRLNKIERKQNLFCDQLLANNASLVENISSRVSFYVENRSLLDETDHMAVMVKLQDLHAELKELSEVCNKPKKEKKEKPPETKRLKTCK